MVLVTVTPLGPGEAGEAGEAGQAGEGSAALTLLDAAERGMGKGEALVAHVVGTGAKARVVDVEVYPS